MWTLKTFSLCIVLFVTIWNCVTAEPQLHTAADGTKFYIEIEGEYNWFQALHECARRGYQLVEVHSGKKNKVLLNALDSFFGKPYNLWLGANDEFNSDRDFNRPFYWASSGKRMTFSNWSSNNPDNFRSEEHCVHTWAAREPFAWNDASCTSKMGYICEERPLA
ncbi:lectin subunit alpha-like [Stomoxys calcitrans]|uniref:C-type lectin domain-containing protein n=1 Tax=Stomoxys calcitrans TaxID=35570 RepID=A0A1I8QFE3_STOCA|nr:lectin subunit alpha-like [Stomoxys calcitrans]